MSQQTSIIEAHLQALTPGEITPDFLDRLVACTDDSLTAPQANDLLIEDALRSLRPRTIGEDRIRQLANIIGDTPFAVDSKIVLFNRKGPNNSNRKNRPFTFSYAAAAAVAIIGAIAALMIPAPITEQITNNTNNNPPSARSAAISTPANFNRNLRETRDEGVIWQSRNQPHRVLRLTFTDSISVTNEKGETIEVRQPRVEYLILPEKID